MIQPQAEPEMIAPGFVGAIPLPALLLDSSARIREANAEAITLFGAHSTGRHFATIIRQPALLDAIEKALRDRGSGVARHIHSDGAQETAYDVSLRHVAGGADPQQRFLLLCFSDVTHLEQAGQMRRDFVANVSHELRTPLTALMGFIETLRGAARDDPAARERFLGIMQNEATRMNRLVGDLLSLSRVESQQRVRPHGQVDVQALLTSVFRSIRPLAEEAGVTLALEAPDAAVVVQGDADQLRQVFTNLIENAIKYGAAGGAVRAVLTQSEREPVLRVAGVRVQIIDSGAGIDPVHLPRLTERFYRADSHRSRELGGTGLGLAIVKHIVSRHRGRLKINSEIGQGSVFTVILPK